MENKYFYKLTIRFLMLIWALIMLILGMIATAIIFSEDIRAEAFELIRQNLHNLFAALMFALRYGWVDFITSPFAWLFLPMMVVAIFSFHFVDSKHELQMRTILPSIIKNTSKIIQYSEVMRIKVGIAKKRENMFTKLWDKLFFSVIIYTKFGKKIRLGRKVKYFDELLRTVVDKCKDNPGIVIDSKIFEIINR